MFFSLSLSLANCTVSGTLPPLTPKLYLRPDGTSLYKRPDEISNYNRPFTYA